MLSDIDGDGDADADADADGDVMATVNSDWLALSVTLSDLYLL